MKSRHDNFITTGLSQILVEDWLVESSDGIRIAYVGPVALPHGGAAARRMLGIAKSLRGGGAEVLFGSGQMAKPDAANPSEFEGFPVHSLNERRSEHLPVLLKHLSYFSMGRRTRAWLTNLDPAPDAVILYSGYLPYFLNLSGWCRKKGIPLIFDAVEWYNPANAPGGAYGPYSWNIEISMRWFAVRNGNIIAISSYLDRYFKERGCRTLRIPPTLEVGALGPLAQAKAEGVLTLAYSGRPGKKDQLDRILESVLRLVEEGVRVRFRMAGVSYANLLSFSSLQRRGICLLPECVDLLGDLTHDKSMELIRLADFSVLLRDSDRVAEAGFPTKVVESLALGTPVISNITSDLGMYLKAGENALICEDASIEALVKILRQASGISSVAHQTMREAARASALEHFDSNSYATKLIEFVKSCQNTVRSSLKGKGACLPIKNS